MTAAKDNFISSFYDENYRHVLIKYMQDKNQELYFCIPGLDDEELFELVDELEDSFFEKAEKDVHLFKDYDSMRRFLICEILNVDHGTYRKISVLVTKENVIHELRCIGYTVLNGNKGTYCVYM